MAAKNGPHPLHALRLRYDTLGVEVTNEFHVGEVTPGVVKGTGIDLLGAFADWWTHGYRPFRAPRSLVGSDAVLATGILQIADEVLEVPILVYLLDIALAGLSDEVSTPPSVSYAVEWITGYSGRRSHGRTYLPSIPRGALEPGREYDLTLDYLRRVRDAYGDLIDMVHNLGPRPGDLTLAVAHKRPRLDGSGYSPWWTPITGIRLPRRRVADMGRRLPHEPSTGVVL